MRKNVLIAGGSGLIGGRLTRLLLERDYVVSWLSRSAEHKTSFRVYHWEPGEGIIEKGAIEQADHIINLAGAPIMHRWTPSYKQQIIKSRVDSAKLLAETLRERPNKVKTYLSASATGYYGHRAEEWATETTSSASDFLGTCCRLWEQAASRIGKPGIRTAILRTGMVLSDKGGALPILMRPVKAGLGAAFGNGRQWISWIHIDDICRLYIHLLEKTELHGVFNGVSPNPVRNKALIKEIATAAGKPLWLPNLPAFALKIAIGKRSNSLLHSTRVSAGRVTESGFRFGFPDLPAALGQLC